MTQTAASPRPAPRRSPLEEPLEALLAIAGVIGAVVATDEGLSIAARAGDDLDEDGLAAAAAVLGRLGRRAAAASGRGEPPMVILDASRLSFIVRPVPLGFLMAVSEPGARMDPIVEGMAALAAVLPSIAGRELPGSIRASA